MPDEIRLTLPWPAKALWPNKRPCRWAKIKSVKKARTDAGLVAMMARRRADMDEPPQWKSACIEWTFYCQPKGPLPDADNCTAAFKPLLDGIVDSGILADDRGVTHEVLRERDGDPRVEVVIKPTTGE